MPTISDMKNKAVLVTGAAAGLGRATALQFARAGANVCLVDIDAEGLEETAAEVKQAGAQALVHVTDLAEAENCHAAVKAAVDAFGRLDSLSNIAGMMKMSHSTDVSPQEWRKTMDINLSAPFFLSQAAIPHLLEADGAIVNVTSCAAYIGEAYLAAYCATKAGLNHMTKAMAMEYINKPIRINAVAPGGMMTKLAMGMQLPEEAEVDLVKRFSPLRGILEVDEVAEMVAYLGSPAATGYHGACINMDRGITAG